MCKSTRLIRYKKAHVKHIIETFKFKSYLNFLIIKSICKMCIRDRYLHSNTHVLLWAISILDNPIQYVLRLFGLTVCLKITDVQYRSANVYLNFLISTLI